MASFKATILAIAQSPKLSECTARQFSVLYAVNAAKTEEARYLKTIAAGLGFSKPATTRSVDRLENLGYLVRHGVENDRRLVDIRITDAGKALVGWLAAPDGSAP